MATRKTVRRTAMPPIPNYVPPGATTRSMAAPLTSTPSGTPPRRKSSTKKKK